MRCSQARNVETSNFTNCTDAGKSHFRKRSCTLPSQPNRYAFRFFWTRFFVLSKLSFLSKLSILSNFSICPFCPKLSNFGICPIFQFVQFFQFFNLSKLDKLSIFFLSILSILSNFYRKIFILALCRLKYFNLVSFSQSLGDCGHFHHFCFWSLRSDSNPLRLRFHVVYGSKELPNFLLQNRQRSVSRTWRTGRIVHWPSQLHQCPGEIAAN